MPAAALAAALASAPAAAEVRYRIEDLNPLFGNALGSVALGFNNAGAITGFLSDTGAFLYRGGRLEMISNPDAGALVNPMALGGRGDVVGLRNTASGGEAAFLYRDGRMTDVAPAGARNSWASDVNDAGHVVGNADGGAFFYDGTTSRYLAFEGLNVQAYGINDHDAVVGQVSGAGLPHASAFVYEGGHFTLLAPLPDGGVFHSGLDLNNAGDILVQGNTNHAGLRSYVYRNGVAEEILPPAGAGGMQGADINARGDVAGWMETYAPDGQPRAFVYTRGRAYNLNDFLPSTWAAEDYLQEAVGINDRGQVLGTASVNGARHIFLATPVPESDTAWLMLCGLGVVAGVARTARGRTVPKV